MKLGKLSRKATAAAIGGALALTGVGVSAAAVLSSPSTETVSDQSEVTEPAATTSSEAAPTTEQAPVEPSASEPTATVADVTPQQTPAPAPAPQPAPPPEPQVGHRPDMAPGQDPAGVGVIGPDGNYTPAPGANQVPVAPLPPAPPLPGEPGYQSGG